LTLWEAGAGLLVQRAERPESSASSALGQSVRIEDKLWITMGQLQISRNLPLDEIPPKRVEPVVQNNPNVAQVGRHVVNLRGDKDDWLLQCMSDAELIKHVGVSIC
jgi:hypothetical protein